MRKQLGDWGVDYFDLYYIHFPVSLQYVDPSVRYPPGWYRDGARKEVVRGKATLQSTWGAMEALVGAGLAKSIGISNYNGALVLDLLAYARIVPQVLQIEHHLDGAGLGDGRQHFAPVVRFKNEPSRPLYREPLLGEHTEEVLRR